MYEIGYTTGTFDLLHKGHFEFLKTCKLYCQKLIVGLVSDELGIKQKREPVLTYEHRKCILENSKYVDTVILFSGTSKQEDREKLKFEILFIADEYKNSDEYLGFEKSYPGIPVIYPPRSTDVSTSTIFKNIIYRIIEDTDKLSEGICGNILSINWKKNQNLIIKPLKLSKIENENTKNNYFFVMPPPRNWKLISEMDKQDKIQNLSGINPYREIKIHDFLKNEDWYCVEKILCKNSFKKTDFPPSTPPYNLDNIISDRNLSEINYWLIQKDGGETLKTWIVGKNREEITGIYRIVKRIIDKMRNYNILHMDIHPENVLVKNNKVSIIDFGWCLHKSFEMDSDEKKYFEACLDNNFDLIHFRESLVYCGLEKEIPECLY